ncbi:alkaline phosphatase family protein [Methylomonas sp. AM2-LC]|uniref:alkaline phosphatase family protein n=1 Tax=Methylomonas sp. AM2-LC TaxID=3153301 RepID=UPI003266D862
MKKTAASLSLLGSLLVNPVLADTSIPKLDHVFVIMMENHAYGQIIGNPNAPFINQLASSANLANKYFAIGHPSLTNYLEVVGGSNFGVQSDHYPDWHSTSCVANIVSGQTNFDNPAPANANVCPIPAVIGADAATNATDTINETQSGTINNIDGVLSIPASHKIVGKTIADQLVAAGLSWKTYQESIPLTGVDGVNVSDGTYSNLTDFSSLSQEDPEVTSAGLVYLYAVKHNPFAYFKSVQEGTNPALSLKKVAPFDGGNGLYADLSTGHVPAFSFIAPNQCNDQHGRGNAGPFCNYDPSSTGTQVGLNPALIQQGDNTVAKIVTAIKKSPAWDDGHNAIVVMWDENDYSDAPNINQVAVIVDTNYGNHGVTSSKYYNHFSLLKTLDVGFGLPCLNHACDANVDVMTDLFGKSSHHKDGHSDYDSH